MCGVSNTRARGQPVCKSYSVTLSVVKEQFQPVSLISSKQVVLILPTATGPHHGAREGSGPRDRRATGHEWGGRGDEFARRRIGKWFSFCFAGLREASNNTVTEMEENLI